MARSKSKQARTHSRRAIKHHKRKKLLKERVAELKKAKKG
jgi:hypothetical protein